MHPVPAIKAALAANRQAAFLPRFFLALVATALFFAGCQKDDPAAAARARDAQVAAALDAANRQLADGQIGPALAALDALYNANPGRYDIVENLATAQAHAGNLPKAAALFAQAAKADPARRALFIYAAGLDTSAGNHADAILQYQAYLKFFPHDTSAHKNLAREFRALNQFQPALDAYLDALKQTGSQPSAADALDIALLYQQLGDRAHANSWFLRVPTLQPDAPTLAHWQKAAPPTIVAKYLNDKTASQKTSTPLAANLTAPPPQAPANTTLAASTTTPASANATLSLSTNTTPPPPPANLTIASSNTTTLTANTSTPPPAANLTTSPSNTTATLASNTTPQTPVQNPQLTTTPGTQQSPPSDPLLAAAQKAAAAGQFPDAIRLYWKVLANDDSSPDTWLALGQAYLANKQYPDAASVAQEAIRRAPANPDYTVFFLQIEKTLQPAARYQAELSAAAQKFPDSADLALTLSDAFHQQNDTRDATLVLTNYLSRAPVTDPRRNDVQDALNNLAKP